MEKTRRKVRPIARKRHNFVYLLLAILFAILTGYIFLNFPPDYKFEIANIEIPILPIFLVSLTGFIFSACTFIFIQKLQGFIISSFILFYLVLRLIDLIHWIFAVMFLALFITVELFVLKKK
ncbi:MAG: hypothetical protein US51_C0043G0004 [Microgenomates group bacterium GW2011_GWA2_37_6]|nr:MAG: hypothetical protein US51_C0043G0004 [Microgenomates group bacterium GW2011_GWA2_37_6]